MIKYVHTSDVHNFSSPDVIVPVLIEKFNPKSVIDVGCGIGTFLNVFRKYGVDDITGIDGKWVNRSQLLIDETHFLERDLEHPLNVEREFDLVLCLEVVEHLNESSSDTIVQSLVSLGKRIIFSAAVTNQGGQNHINEQDFSYWQKKFNTHGYAFYDIFREYFWSSEKIDWWYKQNMFLVAHESVSLAREIKLSKAEKDIPVYIHPGTLATRINQLNHLFRQIEDIKNGNYSVGTYGKAILKKIRNQFKRNTKEK